LKQQSVIYITFTRSTTVEILKEDDSFSF